MQHHQHATRTTTAVAAPAPQMRAHHIPAMHTNVNGTIPAMNMPPQQQPQTTHHIASAPGPSIPATGTNLQSTQQQQHMRDHHARLQHQQAHHTQNLHSSTQMHKLRQQHQHLSNNINKQQQPPLQPQSHQQYPQHPHLNYNHINATQQHMGVATQQQQQQHLHQQQRNVPYHNQPQPQHQHPSQPAQPHSKAAMPPLPQTQHIKNPQKVTPTHLNKPQMPAPTNAVPHHYYNNNNKTKYPNNNYNNNNNNSTTNNNLNGHTNAAYTPNVPKTILQNPNRLPKPRQQTTTQTPALTSTAIPPTTTALSSSVSSTSSTLSSSTPTAAAADNESSTDKTTEPPVAAANALTQIDVNLSNSMNIVNTCNDIDKLPTTTATTPIVSANVSGESKENMDTLKDSLDEPMQVNNEQELCNNNNINNDCSHDSDHSINNNSNKNNNNNNIIISNNNCSNILSNEDLSVHKNSKEKTPMCLVNELARFNKITHQYRLTNEKGPAHCKRFTVTLKLGEEEYSAEGYKIKKAQHLAAAEAIEKTKYKHPVPKTNRRNEDGSSTRTNITPTVELNALAMKLGQPTYYLFDPRQMSPAEPVHGAMDGMSAYVPTHPHMMSGAPPPPPPPPHAIIDPGYMRRNGNGNYQLPPNSMPLPPLPPPPPTGHHRYPNGHQRGMYTSKYPPRYALMHSMAPPPGAPTGPAGVPHVPHPHYAPPLTPCKITLIVGKQKFIGIGRTLQQAKHDAAARALQVLKTQTPEQQCDMFETSLQDNDSKSPISMVHEIGIRRNMSVHFKVLREEGPAHMKNFITACIVGSIITEGEGNGKKISKKRAADKMLEELKKLPPLTPTMSPVKRIKIKTPGKNATPAGVKGSGRKRTNATTFKEKPDEDGGNDDDNPITKLIQLQQNRKEKEPIFELISKNGNEKSRRREFIFEVSVQGMVARGTSNSKKLAKRNAAQNLLIAMGIEPGVETTDSAANAVTTDKTTQNATVEVQTIPANSASTNSITTTTSTTPVEESTKSAADQTTSAIDVPLITTSAGQLPGILILRQNKKHASKKKDAASVNKSNEENQPNASTKANANASKDTTTSTSNIIQHVADSTASNSSVADINTKATSSNNVTSTSNGSSIAATASGTTGSTSTAVSTKSTGGVFMKDQLLYLAKLLGFEVNFSDYPKGNHSEFLTIVTLSSEPPQICHGVGANSEESQNDAAKNALKILSELGLNCAK